MGFFDDMREFDAVYADEHRFGRDFKHQDIVDDTVNPERPAYVREAYKAGAEIVKLLSKQTNCGSTEDLSKGIYAALTRDHRTLQAQSIKALLGVFDLYRAEPWDMRNRAAVRAAEVVTQAVDRGNVYIPLI